MKMEKIQELTDYFLETYRSLNTIDRYSLLLDMADLNVQFSDLPKALYEVIGRFETE